MGRPKKSGTQKSKSGNGANLGFEEKLWAAADKMRGHMDGSEYIAVYGQESNYTT